MAEWPLIVEAIDWDIPLWVISEPSLVWDVVRLNDIIVYQIESQLVFGGDHSNFAHIWMLVLYVLITRNN